MNNYFLKIVDNSFYSINNETFVFGGEMLDYETLPYTEDSMSTTNSFVYRLNLNSSSQCLVYSQNYTNFN